MGLDFYGVTLKKVSDRDRFDEGRNPVHLPSHDTTPCFFGCLRFIMQKNLLQAIDLALAGQWDAAHGIVQQYETDITAAWIHAVLHKIEGDDSNSRYWYRRARKLEHVSDEPKSELAGIRKEVDERL